MLPAQPSLLWTATASKDPALPEPRPSGAGISQTERCFKAGEVSAQNSLSRIGFHGQFKLAADFKPI